MTRVVLDACVLFPSVTREILIGAAKAGFYSPLWSVRILEEWRRAALRHGTQAEMVATGEIALLKASWPDATVCPGGGSGPELWLPDPDDVHVLEAAIEGGADELLTANLKDFPTRILAAYGIVRRDPDGFLLEFAKEHPEQMLVIGNQVAEVAMGMSGEARSLRSLLKKARLPRLGKYLAQVV